MTSATAPATARIDPLRIALAAAILVGIALRLLHASTPSLDSDQAVFGLMARHILAGERPLLQWGVHYMGALQCYVAAAFMAALGPGRFALKLAPAAFSLLFVAAAYGYGLESGDRAAAVASAAFASVGPAYLIDTSVRAEVYVDVLALGTLAMALALAAVNRDSRRGSPLLLAGVGLCLGLALWEQVNALFYGAAILAFMLLEAPTLLGRAVAWAVPTFVLGSAPLLYESLVNGFSLASTPKPVAFSARLAVTWSERLPRLLAPRHDAAADALAIFQVASAVMLAWAALRSPRTPERRAARLLALFGLAALGGYLASPFSGVDTLRYLVPLYTVLAIAPAMALSAAARGSRRTRAAAAAIALSVSAANIAGAVRESVLFDAGRLSRYLDARAADAALIDHLDALGIREVYAADYWENARLMFDSSERLTFATPIIDRRTTYLDAVDASERPAFLFDRDSEAAAFEAMLTLADARYRKEHFAGNVIFSAISMAAERGAELPIHAVAASANAVDAPLAIDHDGATRWESLEPQHRGEWFRIDLGEVRDVSEIALWPRSPNELPRGLRVDVSADGEAWQTMRVAHRLWRPLSWAQGRPLPSFDGWVVARFPLTRCRWIRLVNLGRASDYWGIAELSVRGAPAAAPHLVGRPDPAPGALFADPVLAARIPGAVRHWQGDVLPRHESLRDASLVGPEDRVLLPAAAPLARDGIDPSIGAVAGTRAPLGGYVVVAGTRLDWDRFRRVDPAAWTADGGTETAWIDAGRTMSIAGVVVEHREAASSFPRGLTTSTSFDGARWSGAERLMPRPERLLWSDEGLLGASLLRRVFVFAEPRSARYLEVAAYPRQPAFPWVVRKILLLVAP